MTLSRACGNSQRSSMPCWCPREMVWREVGVAGSVLSKSARWHLFSVAAFLSWHWRRWEFQSNRDQECPLLLGAESLWRVPVYLPGVLMSVGKIHQAHCRILFPVLQASFVIESTSSESRGNKPFVSTQLLQGKKSAFPWPVLKQASLKSKMGNGPAISFEQWMAQLSKGLWSNENCQDDAYLGWYFKIFYYLKSNIFILLFSVWHLVFCFAFQSKKLHIRDSLCSSCIQD